MSAMMRDMLINYLAKMDGEELSTILAKANEKRRSSGIGGAFTYITEEEINEAIGEAMNRLKKLTARRSFGEQ